MSWSHHKPENTVIFRMPAHVKCIYFTSVCNFCDDRRNSGEKSL